MANDKYSVGEYERRFLLDTVPSDAMSPRPIVDHYVDDTRLRLRTVGRSNGPDTHKLGHKRRVDNDDPTAILHTSLYLTEAEYGVLARLPGRRLAKTRWKVDLDGQAAAVDVFAEGLAGLVILEVDLGDPAGLAAFTPPPWAGPEITHDEAFTGGQLAGGTFVDLAAAIAAIRR